MFSAIASDPQDKVHRRPALLQAAAALLGAAVLAFLLVSINSMRNGLAATNVQLQITNAQLRQTNQELLLTNAQLSATNAKLDATNAKLAAMSKTLSAMRGDLSAMARKITKAKLLF